MREQQPLLGSTLVLAAILAAACSPAPNPQQVNSVLAGSAPSAARFSSPRLKAGASKRGNW
jgi:hypothetical protein